MAAHSAIVNQQHRRIGARPHAFALLQGKEAVVRCFPQPDTEFFFQRLESLPRPLQLARQIGAQGDLVFTDRLEIEHVVESGNLPNSDARHAQVISNGLFAFGSDMTLLLLDDGQACQHRRLTMLRRIFGHFALKPRTGSVGKNHRSTSPNTMSSVPSTATASASIWPRVSSFMAARCTNPGGRIFMR